LDTYTKHNGKGQTALEIAVGCLGISKASKYIHNSMISNSSKRGPGPGPGPAGIITSQNFHNIKLFPTSMGGELPELK